MLKPLEAVLTPQLGSGISEALGNNGDKVVKVPAAHYSCYKVFHKAFKKGTFMT